MARTTTRLAYTLLAASSGGLLGCDALLGAPLGAEGSGEIDGGGPALGPGVQSETLGECRALGEGIHPGPAPIRRLTRAEYDKTVQALLGTTESPAEAFPPEARALGFHGVAEGQVPTLLLIESYQTAAEALAEEATADLEGLLGCDPMAADCVTDFVRTFGALAYRRPLADDEVLRLKTVFEWGRDRQSVTDGVAMVLEVLLQSPDFLYRPEVGGTEVEPGIVRLSSREMAVRLSYLFTGGPPDAELRAKADAGALEDPASIEAEARRLLALPGARRTVRAFHRQWLNLASVEHIERDPAIYPGFDESIPELLAEETEAFVEHVIFDDDGRLATLLTAPYTMANARLAEFYGLSGPTGSAFEKVSTDGSRRVGLLTQGSLLAEHAQPLQTSPVHRGKFVREGILCQFLQPPPADLVIQPPDLDPSLTTRERFRQHAEEPGCAGCHQLTDPIGLGFEHFDPVGRWRDDENGLPIDATGEVVEADVAGTFDGAVELSEMLARSDDVAVCMVRQWMRFSYGRSETPEDACTIVALGSQFAQAGYDIKELMLGLTQSEAFLYKAVTE